MADTPTTVLRFSGSCPDCGTRETRLPAPLPDLGDDYDWLVRDYDGFRLFMLEELASRYPERQRWTPADLEVVIIEAMAAVLDLLSDMADRVAAEAYLETARQPERVQKLLAFIGYDAVAAAKAKDQIPGDLAGDAAKTALLNFWRQSSHAMNRARRAGPRAVRTQKRMVSLDDYENRLKEHPLVLDAHAWQEWSGSWFTIRVAVLAEDDTLLDDETVSYTDDMKTAVTNFNEGLGLLPPDFDDGAPPTIRTVLRPYIDAFRMVGQEVIIEDPVYVGIYLSLSIRVADNYFQSEIRLAVGEALGHAEGGFFENGRRSFGEDLYGSDVIETVMALDGVEHVCLNRFKRVGSQHPDRADAGVIPMSGLEVAVCHNTPEEVAMGYYRLVLHGGRRG